MVGPSATGGIGRVENEPLSLGDHRPSKTYGPITLVVEAYLRGGWDLKALGGLFGPFTFAAQKSFRLSGGLVKFGLDARGFFR